MQLEVTNKELVLLKAIDNSNKSGMPQPAHLKVDAADLIARRLVVDGEAGLFVPDHVKLKFLASGQPFER